jgi:hypothetical protein
MVCDDEHFALDGIYDDVIELPLSLGTVTAEIGEIAPVHKQPTRLRRGGIVRTHSSSPL